MNNEMSRIFADFTGKDQFPIDETTFENFETNHNLLEKIAGVCGGNAILWENSNPNASVKKVLWFDRDTHNSQVGMIVPLISSAPNNATIYLHKAADTLSAGNDTYTYHNYYADTNASGAIAAASYFTFKRITLSNLVSLIQDVEHESEQAIAAVEAAYRPHLVPKGTIVMWSNKGTDGKPKDIPEGWALCDGTNGTPDLRGRFIVGYTSSAYVMNGSVGMSMTEYNQIGNTGGAQSVKLTAAQSGLPEHTHTMQSDGTHTHSFVLTKADSATSSGGYRRGTASDSLRHNTESAGSHTHTVNSCSSQNASQAHENRPPYYVLAFIMKTTDVPL